MKTKSYQVQRSNEYYPSKIKIVEVGPRDGLQNIKKFIPTSSKIQFINLLSKTGLRSIESTSFVSPKAIPQFTDAKQVIRSINRPKNISYPVLIANKRGLELALENKVEEVAVFVSSTETFSYKNIRKSISESLGVSKELIQEAIKNNIKVRGYISCVLGCPYEGYVHPLIPTKIAHKLLEYGCYEISLGDTIGIGTPETMNLLLQNLFREGISNEVLAVHCHDTYGRGLENIDEAIRLGVKVIDSSVGGLGGCPYAKGATGNVATEKVVLHLDRLGIQTGVNIDKLIDARNYIQYLIKS